jgi:hypothetical protein
VEAPNARTSSSEGIVVVSLPTAFPRRKTPARTPHSPESRPYERNSHSAAFPGKLPDFDLETRFDFTKRLIGNDN